MKHVLHAFTPLLLAGLMLITAARAQEMKERVPSEGDMAKADKLIKEVFKTEYLKAKPSDRVALAEAFLKQADESKDDPAAAYVLLAEARRLALLGNSVDLAQRATEAMIARYAVDPGATMKGIYEEMVKRSYTRETMEEAVRQILAAMRQSMAENQFDAATELHKLAEFGARKIQHIPMTNMVAERGRELTTLRTEYEKLKPAQAVLAATPNDPNANLIAGRYFCFARGEWDRGLLHLRQCSDPVLRSLAEKEAANLTDRAEQVLLADQWYDGADKQDPLTKKAHQRRAYHWYSKAISDLTGISKLRVEKRILELEPIALADDLGSDAGPSMITLVRQAQKDKNFTTVPAHGGGFANRDFQEPGPDGGILIGFNFALSRFVGNIYYLSSMQPIYRLPSGTEKVGRNVGKPLPPKFLTQKAKPGYAVSAFHVMEGGNLDYFTMTFMKVNARGLDPKTSYESLVMGSPDSKKTIVDIDGKGAPIVGIHGRDSDGGAISIGILTPGDPKTVPPKKKFPR